MLIKQETLQFQTTAHKDLGANSPEGSFQQGRYPFRIGAQLLGLISFDCYYVVALLSLCSILQGLATLVASGCSVHRQFPTAVKR